MSHGLERLTVYYDGAARRKGDRAWKVVVPLSEHVVEHVKLRDVPEPMLLQDGTAAKVEAALPAATEGVERLCGVTPRWMALPSGEAAVHVLDAKGAA